MFGRNGRVEGARNDAALIFFLLLPSSSSLLLSFLPRFRLFPCVLSTVNWSRWIAYWRLTALPSIGLPPLSSPSTILFRRIWDADLSSTCYRNSSAVTLNARREWSNSLDSFCLSIGSYLCVFPQVDLVVNYDCAGFRIFHSPNLAEIFEERLDYSAPWSRRVEMNRISDGEALVFNPQFHVYLSGIMSAVDFHRVFQVTVLISKQRQ